VIVNMLFCENVNKQMLEHSTMELAVDQVEVAKRSSALGKLSESIIGLERESVMAAEKYGRY
jgi:hypothetical protein